MAATVLGACAPESAAAADRAFPAPVGYVNDFADVMDQASADSITALATELREKSGAEMAVVTLPDLGGETIDPVAEALFRQWGIGRKGQDDGVLILLAVAERRVRIETGYGLEGPLPDGRCGAIIRRVMAPALASGRYGEGLLAGARSVAGAIAAERGVAITGSTEPPSVVRRGREAPAWVLFVLFLVFLLVFLGISRFARALLHGPRGDWSGRGWNDPWGGFGGGWGGMGGFGGGRGGGGGGFGGFGGGRSGGGGASGGF